MPGKVNQDWTDDAAFWDDAWADMEQRLDDDKNPQGLLLWTRGAVLFVLLLLGATAAWYLSGNRSDAPILATAPEGSSAPANPAPVASNTSTATESALVEIGTPGKAESKMPRPQAARPAKAENVPPALVPTSEKVKVVIDFGNSAVHTGTVPDPTPSQLPDNLANGNSLLPTASDREEKEKNAAPVNGKKDEPLTVFALQSLPVSKLPTGQELPELSLSRSKHSLPLFLEATGSLSQGRTTPGFSLGAGTLISPKGRVSFPLSLRYRSDLMQLGKRSGGSNDEAIVGLPTADMVNNAIDPLRFSLGAQGTALTTSGLELSAGLQYRLSPRLSVGVNAQLEGLLTANGVINATLDGENLEYLFNNRSTANADLSTSFGNITAANESSSGLSDNSAINRFRLRTGLQVNYQLADSFSVMAGATRIMTPTYSGELLRVRPTQLMLGVQYRIK